MTDKNEKTSNKVDTSPVVGVISSGAPKKAILLAVLVLFGLVVATGLMLYFKSKPATAPVALESGPNIADQVERLDEKAVDSLATAKTDPTKNIDEAFAKASALAKKGDYSAAAGEYRAITATGNAKSYVYEQYALVLARQNDLKGAAAAMQTAIDLLKADTSQSDEAKATELRYLNNKLAGFKEEGKIQ